MTLFTARPQDRRGAIPRQRRWDRRNTTRDERAARVASVARILTAERDRRTAAKTKETP